MSNFVPDSGTIFYVEKRPIRKDVEGLFGGLTAAIVVDNSYSDSIFKCVARDDNVVVATKVYGGLMSPLEMSLKKIFKINLHSFKPVGPDVAKILNLIEESENEKN